MASNRILLSLVTLTVVVVAITVSCTRAASSAVLIDYRRTGGFVGFDDRLVIDKTYKATLTQKTGRYEFVLDQELGDRLLQQFAQADFTRLKAKYLPADTCCDLIEYRITYRNHMLRTMDTAVPATLQPVLDSLNEIIQSRGKL